MTGQDGRAYLSILGWPSAVHEPGRIEILVRAAGMDPYNARLAVRRGVPQVIAIIDPLIAGEVVGALLNAGVSAAAPSREHMESLPPAARARRVGRSRSNPDLIGIKLRDDSTVTIEPERVTAVIRAAVATTRTTIDSGDTSGAMTAYMVGGVAGAAAHAALSGGFAESSSETRALHLVEVQTDEGRRYRFDSKTAPQDKADRLRPAGERMDELAVALTEACPNALLDHGFRDFRCPPDVLRTASSVTGTRTVTTKDEAPLFEFFSAWTWLVGRVPPG